MNRLGNSRNPYCGSAKKGRGVNQNRNTLTGIRAKLETSKFIIEAKPRLVRLVKAPNTSVDRTTRIVPINIKNQILLNFRKSGTKINGT